MNEPKAPPAGDAKTTEGIRQSVEAGTGAGKETGMGETRGKTTSGTAILALLISLVALGAGAYSVYSLLAQQQSTEITVLRDKTAELERSLGQVDRKLNNLTETVTSQLAEQQSIAISQGQQIEQALNRFKSIEETTSRDWMLAEVEYLLRLANQRVLVEKEVDGAVGLLTAADSILRDAGEKSAQGVREAIANDLAMLKSVARVDVDGVFLRIGAQINQVEHLKQQSLAVGLPTSIAEPPAPAVDTPQTGWLDRGKAFAGKLMRKLGELVDYRRGTERINPILPPEEEYYLRQNLVLKLEQAQIALLKGNQISYEYSLLDATKWITTYFDASDAVTRSMLDTLDGLKTIELVAPLPDISSSLLQARKLVDESHSAPGQSTDQTATELKK